jgi:hypothetical protein
MFRFLVLIFLCSAYPIWGNIGPEGFYLFKNKIFLETRCFYGNNIQKAIDAGFEIIYSMDRELNFLKMSRRRFRSNRNVYIYFNYRNDQFAETLKKIDEPATILLDFYEDNFRCSYPFQRNLNMQILDALNQIQQHKIKTHTILIDDFRYFDPFFSSFNLAQLIDKLREINSDYYIGCLDGGNNGELKYDILIAVP